jgi:hypothetical protein
VKFSELVKHNKPELVVSNRYEAWVKENSNPQYSDSAIVFGTTALIAQSTPRDRRGTVSASSLDSCRRRQQFTYLGLSEGPMSAKTAAILQNGTFTHLRWQMAGLSEGWLIEAETPVPRPNPLRLHGTMDGVLYDVPGLATSCRSPPTCI